MYIGPELALESVSRGCRHCIAQHFENAAQRSAELPGRPILRPVSGHFTKQKLRTFTHYERTMHRNPGPDVSPDVQFFRWSLVLSRLPYKNRELNISMSVGQEMTKLPLWIGLLKSSALQNYGLDAPVILQCRTPQETNPKGHGGQITFSSNPCSCSLHVPSLGIPSLAISRVWLRVMVCIEQSMFNLLLGGALGGSWEAGLGLEILAKILAFIH